MIIIFAEVAVMERKWARGAIQLIEINTKTIVAALIMVNNVKLCKAYLTIRRDIFNSMHIIFKNIIGNIFFEIKHVFHPKRTNRNVSFAYSIGDNYFWIF